uniref:Uncharacterized protein n=1 Tax=Dulem virus 134 TaxID=3145611 RepID=A0AAU8B8X3_9VIRU
MSKLFYRVVVDGRPTRYWKSLKTAKTFFDFVREFFPDVSCSIAISEMEEEEK